MLMNDADEWCLSKQEPHDRSVLFNLRFPYISGQLTVKVKENFFHEFILKNQLALKKKEFIFDIYDVSPILVCFSFSCWAYIAARNFSTFVVSVSATLNSSIYNFIFNYVLVACSCWWNWGQKVLI